MTEEELKKQAEDETAAKAEAEAKAKADEEARLKAEEEEDDAFIKSLLGDDGVEETEEQKLQKNKDAEEARKRREAKAKEEAEAKAKAEAEAKAKAEAEAKEKAEAEAKLKASKESDATKAEEAKKRLSEVGKQITDFKTKNPSVDLTELDKDKAFKRFIDGKLLGKKDFTQLYEEFVEMKAEMTNSDADTITKNYQKSNSGSGSSNKGAIVPQDIYSEEELTRISAKIPLMSRHEYAKIEAKVNKSIEYYDKK